MADHDEHARDRTPHRRIQSGGPEFPVVTPMRQRAILMSPGDVDGPVDDDEVSPNDTDTRPLAITGAGGGNSFPDG